MEYFFNLFEINRILKLKYKMSWFGELQQNVVQTREVVGG